MALPKYLTGERHVEPYVNIPHKPTVKGSPMQKPRINNSESDFSRNKSIDVDMPNGNVINVININEILYWAIFFVVIEKYIRNAISIIIARYNMYAKILLLRIFNCNFQIPEVFFWRFLPN